MSLIMFIVSCEKRLLMTAIVKTILATSYKNLAALLRWVSFIVCESKRAQFGMQLLFLFLFLSSTVLAQTTVPQYLNFQSVVMDDSGNLITDPFIDLNFKILDKDGNLVYEEDQKQVQVVKGAV